MCKMNYHRQSFSENEEISTNKISKKHRWVGRKNVVSNRTYNMLCVLFLFMSMYSIVVTFVWYYKLSSTFWCGRVVMHTKHDDLNENPLGLTKYDEEKESYIRKENNKKKSETMEDIIMNDKYMSQITDSDNSEKETDQNADEVELTDTDNGDLEEQLMNAENTGIMNEGSLTTESQSPTPTQEKNTFQKSKDLVIDVISIGCQSKEDYMQAQKETWGLHPSIRNFWPITESDDANPMCMYDTHITNHLNMCKKRLEDDSDFMRSVRNRLVWTEEQMMSSKNPHGWLCAQRRVGAGLAKVGKWYKDQIFKAGGNETGIFPDYLFLIDDDTFINVKLFNNYMREEAVDPAIPMVYGGCLIYKKWKIGAGAKRTTIEWNFPFGGYGLFFSKGSIERLIYPLNCKIDGSNDPYIEPKSLKPELRQFEIESCKQLNLNYAYEKDTYQQGSSISDIAAQLSARNDFCMHSDWLTGYLATYYPLSTYDKSTGQHIHQYRNKQCVFERTKKCGQSEHICHYQNPKSFRRMTFSYNRYLDKERRL